MLKTVINGSTVWYKLDCDTLPQENRERRKEFFFFLWGWARQTANMSRYVCLCVYVRDTPVWHCAQTPHIAGTGPASSSSLSRSAGHDFLSAATHSGCLNKTHTHKWPFPSAQKQNFDSKYLIISIHHKVLVKHTCTSSGTQAEGLAELFVTDWLGIVCTCKSTQRV